MQNIDIDKKKRHNMILFQFYSQYIIFSQSILHVIYACDQSVTDLQNTIIVVNNYMIQ